MPRCQIWMSFSIRPFLFAMLHFLNFFFAMAQKLFVGFISGPGKAFIFFHAKTWSKILLYGTGLHHAWIWCLHLETSLLIVELVFVHFFLHWYWFIMLSIMYKRPVPWASLFFGIADVILAFFRDDEHWVKLKWAFYGKWNYIHLLHTLAERCLAHC